MKEGKEGKERRKEGRKDDLDKGKRGESSGEVEVGGNRVMLREKKGKGEGNKGRIVR